MPETPPKETRRHPRVALTKITVRIPSVDRFREVYLRNLSEGGLYVRTDKPLPIGSEVEVQLWPPGATVALLLPATVVRHGTVTEPPGVGMKLGELTPQAAADLRALLAAHADPDADSEDVPMDMPADVEDVRAQAVGLVAELEWSRAEITRTTADQTQLRAEADRAAGRIRELEQYEADVRRLAERLAQEKSQLEQKLKGEQTQRTSLADSLIAAEGARDQATAACAAIEKDLIAARQELAGVRSSAATLSEKLISAERERDHAKASVETTLQQAKQERLETQTTLEALRAELAAAVAERDTLRERPNAEHKVSALEQELAAQKKLTVGHEHRILELTAETERQRGVERDLRRLLSALGSEDKGAAPVPAPAVVPASPPPAASPTPTASPAGALSGKSSWEDSIEDVLITSDET